MLPGRLERTASSAWIAEARGETLEIISAAAPDQPGQFVRRKGKVFVPGPDAGSSVLAHEAPPFQHWISELVFGVCNGLGRAGVPRTVRNPFGTTVISVRP
jgi:hypothetical protein